MATSRINKLILCDTESERSLDLGNGQMFYCLDTNKIWQKI